LDSMKSSYEREISQLHEQLKALQQDFATEQETKTRLQDEILILKERSKGPQKAKSLDPPVLGRALPNVRKTTATVASSATEITWRMQQLNAQPTDAQAAELLGKLADIATASCM